MKPFDYHSPASIEEALGLLEKYGEDAKLYAGGTSLLFLMKEGLFSPEQVVNIKSIQGLDAIETETVNGEERVRLGALAKHRALELSDLLKEKIPVIPHVESDLANVRVRNVGTLGGSLAFAEPQSDPPTLLMALGAEVGVVSPNGKRTLGLDSFYLGYYETVLSPSEMITHASVPVPSRGMGCSYQKFCQRTATDKPTVCAAVCLKLEGGAVDDVRIVLGAVGPTPIRAKETESLIQGFQPNGKPFSAELLEEAAQTASGEIDPQSDIYGSDWYKRDVAMVLVKRGLVEALERASAA
jgi:carbon-monoxide dehydrogenase medium subunit